MNESKATLQLIATLDALEQELLAADVGEVLAAARSLGLDPDMKGSIALVGVTQFVPRRREKPADPAKREKTARRRKPGARPT
jgi:hypothetical protein